MLPDAGRSLASLLEQLVLVAVVVDQRVAAIMIDTFGDLGAWPRRSGRELSKLPRWAAAMLVTMADMRAHHLRQRPDLARMVHADLEDAEIGVSGMRASVSGTPQ